MMKGYLSIVLDATTVVALRSLAVHPIIYCEHITLAYKPSQEVFAKYVGLIGQTVEFALGEVVTDERGQAVTVHGIATENAHAHVTISCAHGTKPAYSNELLQTGSQRIPFGAKGRGRVAFISFHNPRHLPTKRAGDYRGLNLEPPVLANLLATRPRGFKCGDPGCSYCGDDYDPQLDLYD
jgi:hypothetical protein